MSTKFKTFTETRENGKTYLIIENLHIPLLQTFRRFEVEIPEEADPLVYYTATTGMIETIGNVASADTATGYAFHEEHHLFRIKNTGAFPVGERVYITEHLRLDGHAEYLATKHRISCGNNNFVNVGYILDGNRVDKLIIDVVTGEHRWL